MATAARSSVQFAGGCPHLHAFLQGTIVRSLRKTKGGSDALESIKSPVLLLKGHVHILRMIWVLVCEEWWDLHIEKSYQRCCSMPNQIPELLPWQPDRNANHDTDEDMLYPKERKSLAGCPVAVVQKGIAFPAPKIVPIGTFASQTTEHLYVNMMPFELHNRNSLPACCQQYWYIIVECAQRLERRHFVERTDNIAYLTIDERPVAAGQSQRRPGLHVESPGVLRVTTATTETVTADSITPEVAYGSFVPGAEHHWGDGLMMRDESMRGGIFMVSNVSDSCAVWNARVYDPHGHVIGAHGDIEHCRSLLDAAVGFSAPAAAAEYDDTIKGSSISSYCSGRKLSAGELVWMTDMTPHESLPLQEASHRQYFRLVVGDISAWFAAHSTPNPVGCFLPPRVRVVEGDKFAIGKAALVPHLSPAEEIDLVATVGTKLGVATITDAATATSTDATTATESESESLPSMQPQLLQRHSWYCGGRHALAAARKLQDLRMLMIQKNIGHLIGGALAVGIDSIEKLGKAGEDILKVRDFGYAFHEMPALRQAIAIASKLR